MLCAIIPPPVRRAGSVTVTRWRLRQPSQGAAPPSRWRSVAGHRWVAPAAFAIAGVAVMFAAAAFGWQMLRRDGLLDDTRFSIARWEATTLLNRWAYELGRPFRDDPPDAEALRRYFAATAALAALEQDAGDRPDAAQAAELARLRDERRRMENHVESIIEGRIAAVAGDAGLRRGVPLFADIVWPPVDFELTAAQRVLAISPRNEIRLVGDDLLNTSLSSAEAAELEREATAGGRVAVVLPTSGVAAYPSIVDEGQPYDEMVETAAHEWLHQYLYFYPLGRGYFDDGLRAVNETVASIAAHDIATLVLARYPAPDLPPARAPDAAQRREQVDVRAELVALRAMVEPLLAQGRIEEAEALMEATRLDLERRGVRIRRINQAYFAFRGLYATSGASGDDLGERLQALRASEGSVGAFLAAVRGVGSRAEIDALLPVLPE